MNRDRIGIALFLCLTGAWLSAIPQLEGLRSISAAQTPAPIWLRLLAQLILSIPVLFFLLHRSIKGKLKNSVSWTINAGMLLGIILYTHLPSPFFDYIWDVFLIEAIFIFLISHSLLESTRTEGLFIWPLRFLLFKLMFCMGVVKFFYGMPEWKTGLALKYFWANQPMPTQLAWYAAQIPDSVQKTMVFFVFLTEVPGPFLIFAGKMARKFFFWMIVVLQTGIFLTGNYSFFNPLTIIVSFSLLELKMPVATKPANINARSGEKSFSILECFRTLSLYSGSCILVIWMICSSWYICKTVLGERDFVPETHWVFLKEEAQRSVSPVMSGILKFFAATKAGNPYALFANIPKYRMEIALEGSHDGITWKRYQFMVKPDNPAAPPVTYAPHHWRLDHQFYYESFRIRDAARHAQQSYFLGFNWMPYLLKEIFSGNQSTSRLFRVDPFVGQPPVFLRFSYLYYEFTSYETLNKSKQFWQTTTPHKNQFYEDAFRAEQIEKLP